MSRVCFDFLSDSLLLDTDAQENLFAGLSDEELVTELSRYREHVLARIEEVQAEVLDNTTALGAYFGTSLSASAKIQNLLRASLYFDRLVIDDPLFPHSRKPASISDAFAEFFGYETGGLNRQAVSDAGRLVLMLQPLVAAGVLKLVPSSLQHEPPREIGLTYSPTLFAERVPDGLLAWFHGRADVVPMKQVDGGGWSYRKDSKLEPCRAIAVTLRGHDHGMCYHLPEVKYEPHPEDDDRFRLYTWIPDEPPSGESFDAWVTQCINQASGVAYAAVAADIVTAAATGSMILTDSEFVSDLLEVRVSKNGTLREDLANLAMRFELPFMENLTIADVVRIRQSEGEAFQNYRLELQRHLRDIRGIVSEEELARRLEDIQHEIVEVQVRRVEQEIRRLRRDLFRGAAIGAASLSTMIPTQGLSLAGLVLATSEAVKSGLDYVDMTRRDPSYFVWRLRREVNGPPGS